MKAAAIPTKMSLYSAISRYAEYELATGREVGMPSPYDEFSDRAAPDYSGGTAEERARRDLLRAAMEKEGFAVAPAEWWHFNYEGWESYPILDVPFEAIR